MRFFKNIVYKGLTSLLSPRYGKRRYQPFFEALYKMALTGMNIGGGTHVADSGELNGLYYIKSKLQSSKGSRNWTLFDVGANIGDYSLLLNEVFGARASIYSFEPSAKTYRKLTENTAVTDKISRYNFALGDKDARTILYSDIDESGLASVYKRQLDHFNIEMSQSEEIEIKTLDSFCTDKGISHIDFLKLDVEGHEIKVLDGAKAMLNAGSIDFIQFEFGGTDIDSRTFFRDFYNLLNGQYQIYRIVRDGVFPIRKYDELYESFLPTNYLAERRKFV